MAALGKSWREFEYHIKSVNEEHHRKTWGPSVAKFRSGSFATGSGRRQAQPCPLCSHSSRAGTLAGRDLTAWLGM